MRSVLLTAITLLVATPSYSANTVSPEPNTPSVQNTIPMPATPTMTPECQAALENCKEDGACKEALQATVCKPTISAVPAPLETQTTGNSPSGALPKP